MAKQIVFSRWSLLVGVGLIVALLGLIATSQIRAPGSDETLVRGCVDDGTGVVWIVEPDEVCQSTETALDCNAQGLNGDKGDKGDPGIRG